jgi:addiction module HigA family antidote
MTIDAAKHPGAHLRAKIIPKGMAVTKAAEVLGVSRPTLSNLLNGNAALSPDMAIRLEKVFNVPRAELMEMQARYDEAQARHQSAPASAQPYVPPFLSLKANDIEAWVEGNIASRSRLAVFLRMLVHSTGRGLAKVDFPGNDDAEKAGWDGLIEAAEATPWIPQGTSGWEFGVNKDIKKKADGDYAKSLDAVALEARRSMTFVFVTPRRWAGKAAWVKTRAAEGAWKAVVAYDAGDLEQWLEQSIAGQTWFANETERPARSVRTLERVWKDWAQVTTPPLAGALFASAREATTRVLKNYMLKPEGGPIVIAADSIEEALAYLAQTFTPENDETLGALRDRVLVFDTPGVLPDLAQGAPAFVPVATTREVERELAALPASTPAITIYPRNVANPEPHIVLEPAGYETFKAALEAMGKDRDDVDRLGKESGRSLTVLRRRLATIPAIRTPAWAAEIATARALRPFLFVGAWNTHNEADKTALALLTDTDYSALEDEAQHLTRLNDTPVWSIGAFRGAVSKIDLLFAIADVVTSDDLAKFYDLARMVLGEDDPALDLPEKDRWAAAIHGKSREFSAAFRNGVRETLVLLAVHGAALFRKRIGVDTEVETIKILRELLPTPLTSRALEAQDSDLPTYAEAAPDEFLSIIERDLTRSESAVLGLLRPADASIFGAFPSRTGLLWALEGLAWNPRTLPRVVFLLAQLAKVEINDNWGNKPIESLLSIFRAWMPQTAADLDTRKTLLSTLAEKYPETGWTICMAQFGEHHQVGDYTHKPRWRADGYGYGEPVPTWGPIHAFARHAIDLALAWPQQTLKTLSDLIDRLHDLDPTYRTRVWELVEAWATREASDAEKAALRDKIRTATLSPRGARRAKKSSDPKALIAAAKAAYSALEPSDPLNRHAWLFKTSWVDWDAAELDSAEELDFDAREARITSLRLAALKAVFDALGVEGIFELARRGDAAWAIGVLLPQLFTADELHAILVNIADRDLARDDPALRALTSAMLHAITEDAREALFSALLTALPAHDVVRFFFLAPFTPATWKRVAGGGADLDAAYWRDAPPEPVRDSVIHATSAVEKLLGVGRPMAAFASLRFFIDDADPELLMRLFLAIARNDSEVTAVRIEHYHLKKVFARISSSAAIPLEQKALLEFAWLEGLAHGHDERKESEIPSLEALINDDPTLFIQAVAWMYKRKDGGVDPEPFRVPKERVSAMAEKGYKLLRALRRIPGRDENGALDGARLGQWVGRVRQGCDELSRQVVGDLAVGELLAHAPSDLDGVWPCRAVRDVVEDVHSEDIVRGMSTGAFNARGTVWRGAGGDQEREIAERYRRWGQAIQASHPFVANHLLFGLAKTYEYDAEREDLDAHIRRRLE